MLTHGHLAWYPQPRKYHSGPYTVDGPEYSKVDGETIPRRNWRCKDGLIKVPEEGINTVYDILKRSSAKFGNAKAVGYRKTIKIHTETKKVKKVVDGKEQQVDKEWTYPELSGYHYLSFIEFEKMAVQAGYGLRKLGLGAGDRLHLFASTRYDFYPSSSCAVSIVLTISQQSFLALHGTR